MLINTLDIINASTGVHPVGERISKWTRQHSAKELARIFNIAVRTGESWRNGNLPQMKHLIQMADRWGAAFLEDVFAPVLAETDSSLAQRLERLERDIHTLKVEAINEENNRPDSGENSRLDGRSASGRGPNLATAFKSVGIILATIAVVGTLFPAAMDTGRARGGFSRTVRVRSDLRGK